MFKENFIPWFKQHSFLINRFICFFNSPDVLYRSFMLYKTSLMAERQFANFAKKSLKIQSQVTILARRIICSKLNFRQSRLPIFGQRNSSIGFVGVETRDHLDALDDGADRVAEGAARASVVVHLIQVKHFIFFFKGILKWSCWNIFIWIVRRDLLSKYLIISTV